MRIAVLIVLVLAMFCMGCGRSVQQLARLSGGGGEGVITVSLNTKEGLNARYQILAPVPKVTRADVGQLVVKLYRVQENLEIPVRNATGDVEVEVGGNQLDSALSFAGLGPALYRIRAFAFDHASRKISNDVRSFHDAWVGPGVERVSIVLPVVLSPTEFSASGGGSHPILQEGALVTLGQASMSVTPSPFLPVDTSLIHLEGDEVDLDPDMEAVAPRSYLGYYQEATTGDFVLIDPSTSLPESAAYIFLDAVLFHVGGNRPMGIRWKVIQPIFSFHIRQDIPESTKLTFNWREALDSEASMTSEVADAIGRISERDLASSEPRTVQEVEWNPIYCEPIVEGLGSSIVGFAAGVGLNNLMSYIGAKLLGTAFVPSLLGGLGALGILVIAIVVVLFVAGYIYAYRTRCSLAPRYQFVGEFEEYAVGWIWKAGSIISGEEMSSIRMRPVDRATYQVVTNGLPLVGCHVAGTNCLSWARRHRFIALTS